jgi:hypothetical protein
MRGDTPRLAVVRYLVAMEERPWGGFGKGDKPLTPSGRHARPRCDRGERVPRRRQPDERLHAGATRRRLDPLP